MKLSCFFNPTLDREMRGGFIRNKALGTNWFIKKEETRIEVKSILNHGTEFIIKLPLPT
jgi:hypothetical protein